MFFLGKTNDHANSRPIKIHQSSPTHIPTSAFKSRLQSSCSYSNIPNIYLFRNRKVADSAFPALIPSTQVSFNFTFINSIFWLTLLQFPLRTKKSSFLSRLRFFFRARLPGGSIKTWDSWERCLLLLFNHSISWNAFQLRRFELQMKLIRVAFPFTKSRFLRFLLSKLKREWFLTANELLKLAVIKRFFLSPTWWY